MLDLPGDVWEQVADFCGSPLVSTLCRTAWRRLRHRHVARAVTAADVCATVDLLVGLEAMQGLAIRGVRVGVSGPRVLAQLSQAAQLRDLTLDLRHNPLGPGGARALALLHAAPALTALHLNLEGGGVGDGGVRLLAAAFAHAPALQTIELLLRGNGITDAGGYWLGAFRSAPALRRVTLDLEDNAVGLHTAQAIGTLRLCPALTALSVQCSQLGDAGVQALGALADAPHLKNLTLHLRRCRVRDGGAMALARLKDAPALCQLTLQLENNCLGEKAGVALAQLMHCPALTHLTLNLRNNALLASGALALVALGGAVHLSTLRVDLGWNDVGDGVGDRIVLGLASWDLEALEVSLGPISLGIEGQRNVRLCRDGGLLRALAELFAGAAFPVSGARAHVAVAGVPGDRQAVHLALDWDHVGEAGERALRSLAGCLDATRIWTVRLDWRGATASAASVTADLRHIAAVRCLEVYLQCSIECEALVAAALAPLTREPWATVTVRAVNDNPDPPEFDIKCGEIHSVDDPSSPLSSLPPTPSSSSDTLNAAVLPPAALPPGGGCTLPSPPPCPPLGV
eukprot:EG_transcript_6343